MSSPNIDILAREYKMTAEPVFEAWLIRDNTFTRDDLDRMADDREYFDANRERLENSVLLARKIASEGSVRGFPWWTEDSRKPLPGATGLAAMYPQTEAGETVYSSPGQPPELDVRAGADEIRIRGGASGIPHEKLAEFGKNYDNSILAAQQLGIQRWGRIRLEGSEAYMDRALDVAVRNGTWPWIENPELLEETGNRVRSAINFNRIWKSLGPGAPDFGNDNGLACEQLLFGVVQRAARMIQANIGRFGYRDSRELTALLARIDRFDRDAPGALINKILKEKASEGADYSSSISRVMGIVQSQPDIAREIREMSVRMTEAMGLAQGAANPVERIVAASQGSGTEPEEVAKKAAVIAESLEREAASGRLEESLRESMQKTARQARKISGAEAHGRMSLVKAIMDAETDTEDGAYSRNLQDVRRRIIRNGIRPAFPEFRKGEIRKMIADPDSAAGTPHARFRLRQRPEDIAGFMRDHNGMAFSSGAMTFEWKRNDTADGPTLFLMQKDGAMESCEAIMLEDVIVSYRPKTKHGILAEAIRKTLGETEEILSSEEKRFALAAQDQEKAQEQRQKNAEKPKEGMVQSM